MFSNGNDPQGSPKKKIGESDLWEIVLEIVIPHLEL